MGAGGEPTIRDSISAAYEELPPGEQRLADTILSRLSNLASYSATELAADAGVSKATAARFFRRIGYSSFGQARRRARAEADLASPLYALAGVKPKERPSDALSRHVAADLRNLSETFHPANLTALPQVVKLLATARRLRFVGMRNGHFVAAHAAYLLAQLRGEVAVLPGPAMTLAEDLASLGRGDAVVAVDFRRRSSLLQAVVQAARGTGAKLVFIAGAGMPPFSPERDLVLRCRTEGASLFDSYVGAVSLVNYLAGSVAVALGRRSRKRLADIESLHGALSDIRP